ncbi:MAG: glycogen debranching protein GlgX [Pirellulales bacterium]|nr:glycogen debranching protein GlgX [Pirellulales bacterium]
MNHTHPPLDFAYPLPYGARVRDGGVHFTVFSRSATGMRLLLYADVHAQEPCEVIQLDPATDRWGDVWSVFVPGLAAGQLYHVQADGPFDPSVGQRFDSQARLVDPYAEALAGDFQANADGIIRPPRCVVVDDHFDWGGDRHLRRPLADTVIYELHVAGFTKSATSEVSSPGTYLGLIEKIPYLQSLGITAVELMPVHEFPILDWNGFPPERFNYWGYDPLAFFSPHRGYAGSDEPGAQVREFKQLVRELHKAGIEVILDVVFNHTCEGNELGPTLSFKGLENRIYYMLENGGDSYRNYSGCGNTINGNHPVVREMIFHCLRHWVLNYHVDGFRFDLASILSRNRQGELIPNPPMVEVIAEDPLLADTKVIAEAWDAAGGYQVGTFATMRWAEWNGRYRDDARRYWRGDSGVTGALATRLAGSSDLYQTSGRSPYHSINFITSHDGFPLNDLVSYSHKHNEANNEGNRDGENNNYSSNYGIEGPADDPEIQTLRLWQIKNFLATMLLSQGVPMITAGDECRRTQGGNNNAWCQDNDTSWFDWRLVKENAELVRFLSMLTALRKAEPTLRQRTFLTGEPRTGDELADVSWYGPNGESATWGSLRSCLTCVLAAAVSNGESGAQAADSRYSTAIRTPHQGAEEKTTKVPHDVMILTNAGTKDQAFHVPSIVESDRWRVVINTAAEAPADILQVPKTSGQQRTVDNEAIDRAPVAKFPLTVPARSLICLMARPE